MRKIKTKKLALLAFLISSMFGFALFFIDQALLPPQEKIEDMVKYADNIAYLRQGVNEAALSSKSQDVKVVTELDEKSKDKSELHYIVKLQHKDHLGYVEVDYPCKRDGSGKLMIGVPYRNTKVYLHTISEYIMISFISFILLLGLFCIISIEIIKSGKSDA